MDWKNYGTNPKQARLPNGFASSVFQEKLPYDLRVGAHQHIDKQLVDIKLSRNLREK